MPRWYLLSSISGTAKSSAFVLLLYPIFNETIFKDFPGCALTNRLAIGVELPARKIVM